MKKEKKLIESNRNESGIAAAETASRECEGPEPGRQNGRPEPGRQNERPEPGRQNEGDRISAIESTFGKFPATMKLLCETEGFKVGEKMERFMAGVGGFARGSGKRYEEVDAALEMLFMIGMAGAEGGFTLDMLETMMKGLSYDRMLAEEVHAAEVRGRNANIEARMQMATDSDGVPHIESRSGGAGKRDRGIFSLADGAR
ncbi:MAG: hypothetical protein HDS36_02130 [Bacteroides sp.]|nr:hypothetical protein [Bacteroides sp.]